MRHRFRRNALFAAALCTALPTAACAGVPGNARTEASEASGDGILRIGLLLDNTGDNAFLNAPQLAAAELAVREINAGGGHKGRPMELLPATPGETPAAQANTFVTLKADVVIGPTDSANAPEVIDVLSRARTPLVSPANTAAGLSSAKSGGYYFRTAAADVAQAPVLVKLAKETGAARISVMHQEGSYGRDVSAAVVSAAGEAGLEVGATASFKAGDAGAAAAEAGDADGAVILVARDGAQGALAELNNAGVDGSRIILSDGAFARYGQGLAAAALDGARAVVPGRLASAGFQGRILEVDKGLRDMSFAAETYDAVTLAALAAARAQDDAGRSIAANLIAVSGGSEAACTAYKECLAGLSGGGEINYDGESGPVAFDANGDITSASFMVFTYGADNNPAPTGTETAGKAGS
ncbi:ABC transporter substrate-binding protein [Pseudarthrobacter sp. NPDC058362]|uniref:ABC transporter substrate-binding protein n=1 Tax=Pseudarthrobacter sp. NPDC058362 TaxID=3346458 RepID=UPI00365357B5